MFFYTPDCHNNQASFITLEPNVRQNEIVLPHPVHRTKQTHAQIQKGPQLHIEYLITLQMKLGVTYHMSQCDLTLNLSSKIYVSHDTTIIINHLNLPLIIGPRFLQPFQQPRPCGNFNLAASVRSNKEKSPKQEDKQDCLIKWIAFHQTGCLTPKTQGHTIYYKHYLKYGVVWNNLFLGLIMLFWRFRGKQSFWSLNYCLGLNFVLELSK